MLLHLTLYSIIAFGTCCLTSIWILVISNTKGHALVQLRRAYV